MSKTIIIASHSAKLRNDIVGMLQQFRCKLIFDVQSMYELFDSIKLNMPGFQAELLVEYFQKSMVQPPLFMIIGRNDKKAHTVSQCSTGCSYFDKPLDEVLFLQQFETYQTSQQDMQLSEEELIRKAVSNWLQQMRTPPHMFGYACLRDGITQMVLQPHYHQMITKVVYADLAQLHDTTKTHVERAIRSAIENVWSNGDRHVIKYFFGYGPDNQLLDSRRPSNAKFMAAIAEKVRLEQDKYKNQM